MAKEYIDKFGMVKPVPNDTKHPYSHLSVEECERYFGKMIMIKPKHLTYPDGHINVKLDYNKATIKLIEDK
jgi:hypothetical protein